MYQYFKCICKLWNAIWFNCVFWIFFHTLMTTIHVWKVVSAPNFHRTCICLMYIFWYINMPNVTASYGTFLDLITFFGNLIKQSQPQFWTHKIYPSYHLWPAHTFDFFYHKNLFLKSIILRQSRQDNLLIKYIKICSINYVCPRLKPFKEKNRIDWYNFVHLTKVIWKLIAHEQNLLSDRSINQ